MADIDFKYFNNLVFFMGNPLKKDKHVSSFFVSISFLSLFFLFIEVCLKIYHFFDFFVL